MTSSLRSRTLLTIVAMVVQGAVRLLYSILVGRFTSRELLGQTNTSLSTAVLASQLWAAPAGAAGTKYVALRRAMDDEEGAKAVARHLALRTAVISVVLPTAVSVIGSRWLGLDDRQVIMTCVLAWAYSVYNTLRGIKFGEQQYGRVAVLDSVAAATGILVLAIVLVLDLRALILLPLTLGYALFAALAWPRRTRARLDPALRREVDTFVLLGVVSGVASGGLIQTSQLAAHAFGGDSGAGEYAAALTLATPPSMLAIALSTVVIPPLVAAATKGDHEGVRRSSDRLARQLTALFVGLFGSLVIVAPTLMGVYGSGFASSIGQLRVLLLALMLTSISVAANATLTSTSTSGPWLVAGLNLAGLLASLATWPWLADAHGSLGVAYGVLIGSAIASAGSMAVVWHRERQQWWGLLGRIVVGVALALALAAATRGVPGVGGVALQGGATLIFLATWALLNRSAVTMLTRTLLGRSQS